MIEMGAVLSLIFVCLLVGAFAYRQASPGAPTGRRLLISAGISIAAVVTVFALLLLVFALGGTPEQ